MTDKNPDVEPGAPVPVDEFAAAFADVEPPSRDGDNPFEAIVASMVVGGKAKTGPVPYRDDPKETGKRAEARVGRQLTDAGDKVDVTVRRTFSNPESGTHTVTFWTVNKVSRKGPDMATLAAEAEAKAKPSNIK